MGRPEATNRRQASRKLRSSISWSSTRLRTARLRNSAMSLSPSALDRPSPPGDLRRGGATTAEAGRACSSRGRRSNPARATGGAAPRPDAPAPDRPGSLGPPSLRVVIMLRPRPRGACRALRGPMHDASTSPSDLAGVRPPGARELTFRSIVVAMLVAAVIGGSYPYVVLKLGFGPNISVVSAFFGYLALGIAFRNFNRWENNIVQTAGTSAGQTAFMCVLMAAFDMLRMDPSAHFTFVLLPYQAFLWLTTAGVLGVLLSVPMRQ